MGQIVHDVTEPVAADPIVLAPRPTAAAAPEERWRRSRHLLAGVLSLSLLLAPAAVACAVALGASMVAPPPKGDGVVVWWLAVLAASAVAASGSQHMARRAMPSLALLRMALLIPADVSSRLGLAMRAGTVRDLERGVIDLRDGVGQDVTDAMALVVAYAAALQRHDRFTRGHCERVRAYTDLLAAEMGVAKEGRALLRWAALLHDIGKAEVSADLLNKPGALDDDEWLAMREHAAAGARLGEPLRVWLGEWVDAIGQHHERFDGTGYPLGLAGTDIALGARIVGVADSYETMTARRPYKTPMTHADARRELVAQAGRHFDPVVVHAMLRLSVRKMRWAAGPYAVVGDALASTLIRHLGPRAERPRGAMQTLRLAAFTTALATAGVVGSSNSSTAEAEVPRSVDAQPASSTLGATDSAPVVVVVPPIPAEPDSPITDPGSPPTTAGTAPSGGQVERAASSTTTTTTAPDVASPVEAFDEHRGATTASPATLGTPSDGRGARAVPATPATPATRAAPSPNADD